MRGNAPNQSMNNDRPSCHTRQNVNGSFGKLMGLVIVVGFARILSCFN